MRRLVQTLLLAACGWSLFACLAQAQAPQPAGPLRIVDATNAVVGPVIDLNGGGGVATTVIRTGSLRFELGVRKPKLFSFNESNEIYFQSNNCSGQPYVVTDPTDSELLLDRVQIVGNRSSVYAPAAGAIPALIVWLSKLNIDGNCIVPGPPFPPPLPFVEAAKIVDLRDYFTPPFALQEVAAPLATASVPMLGWPELVVLSLLIIIVGFGVPRMSRRDKHLA